MRAYCTNALNSGDMLKYCHIYEVKSVPNHPNLVKITSGPLEGTHWSVSRFQFIHEQAEVVIAHPYTVLTWTKDRGFQPCGLTFKTSEAVFNSLEDMDLSIATYIHTPSGCLYTPNAIKTLGLNLWKEVNKE